MLERAKSIKRVPLVPGHWFSAAASECSEMYVRGFFYGAISIAQAYVEVLGRYLASANRMRIHNASRIQWHALATEAKISFEARDAAHAVMDSRNDYHHLNKDVATDYSALEARARSVVNHIYTIDSDVFECSASKMPGVISPKNPQYWPSAEEEGKVYAFVRSVW